MKIQTAIWKQIAVLFFGVVTQNLLVESGNPSNFFSH
jgi:hypothetical protein